MDNQHKKIKGYRDLSQEEIDVMNECKELASKVGELCDKLSDMESTDNKWIDDGTITAQKAFMSLIRGVAKPTTF